MTTKNCKECGKEFTLTQPAQKYCSDECRGISRKTYMQETMALRREVLFFEMINSAAKDVPIPDDQELMVAWYRTPGLLEFIRNCIKDGQRVVGIKVTRNETGIVVVPDGLIDTSED